MKLACLTAFATGLCVAIPIQAATVKLPASAAAPLGSSTTRGFLVRSVQAPSNAEVGNNSLRATRQGPGAAALLQTSSLHNTDDGDLFWQGNNFGQGTGGYNGTGIFTPGEWHRVVAAYDMAANSPVVVKYVDGVFQDNWTAGQSLDNPRRALQPTAILFADGDQDERREWWVNAVQIRSAEIESMGGPSAAGIPVVLTVQPPPSLSFSLSLAADELTITWPAEAAGYVLESSLTLEAGSWSDVPGVSGNSATVPTTGDAQFCRLRRL